MVKSLKRLGILWFLLLCALIAAPVSADDFHYVNMMVGERAVGLGGAYTAVSDNPDGLYYNPAGIVYSGSHNMAASMNAYQATKTVYEKALFNKDWVRQSDALRPNYFGMTQQFGDFWVGFSYAVPDASIEIQRQDIDLNEPLATNLNFRRFLINYDERTTVMLYGPSIAGSFNKWLSAGLTLYVMQRDNSSINNQIIHYDNAMISGATAATDLVNIYETRKEMGLHPILGIMMETSDDTAVGIRLAKTVLFSADRQKVSSTKGFYVNSSGGLSYSPEITTVTEDSDAKREYPWEAAVGFAWFPSKTFLLSADFSYFTGTKAKDVYSKKEPVWNANLGVEYYLSDAWAVRGGLFTNRANTPDLKTGKTYQSAHVDLYGGTMSVLWFSKGTTISAGVGYSGGKGKDQIFLDQPTLQDITTQSYSLFLATSYSY